MPACELTRDTVTLPMTLDVPLTPQTLANAFCDMGDEAQAQFFIEAAAIARSWDNHPGIQWYSVGRHLVTCECSTQEARDMIRDLHRALRPEET